MTKYSKSRPAWRDLQKCWVSCFFFFFFGVFANYWFSSTLPGGEGVGSFYQFAHRQQVKYSNRPIVTGIPLCAFIVITPSLDPLCAMGVPLLCITLLKHSSILAPHQVCTQCSAAYTLYTLHHRITSHNRQCPTTLVCLGSGQLFSTTVTVCLHCKGHSMKGGGRILWVRHSSVTNTETGCGNWSQFAVEC